MTTDENVSDLIQDPQAWQEGYVAGRRGLTGMANPYPAGGTQGLSWQAGLRKGRTKRLGIVRSCN
jgi:hypothetical protein